MTINQIENKATSLLKDFNLLKAPVDVKKVIKNLNVSLEPEKLGSEVSGLLVIENNKAVIGYNSDEPTVRQRFTLAHEIGHYVIHCNSSSRDKIFVDKIMYRKNFSSTSEKRQELQANVFAASLLMPKQLVKEEFANLLNAADHITEEDIVYEMSTTFKVSEIAMTYRLINLNLLQR